MMEVLNPWQQIAEHRATIRKVAIDLLPLLRHDDQDDAVSVDECASADGKIMNYLC